MQCSTQIFDRVAHMQAFDKYLYFTINLQKHYIPLLVRNQSKYANNFVLMKYN